MGIALKITLISTAVVCAIVLFVTLLAVSIKVIQNDELGIRYHTITKIMHEDKVYQEGRYTLQPGETFFIFKRRYVTISLNDVLCLTQDGLQADLDVTFQYRLIQDQLVSFFKLYGDDYENIISLLAQTAIRDTCGKWGSDGFYYAREEVQQEMASRMNDSFTSIHVEAGFLQLSNVDLPTDFQTIVRSVQEAKQDSEQAVNERDEQLTIAQTDVLQAIQTASIINVNSTAQAYGIETQANAQAEVIAAQLAAQTSTYSAIMSELGLGPEDLVNYISLNTIQNSLDPIIAVDSPASFAFSSSSSSKRK